MIQFNPWRLMDSAPKDRTIEVYVPELERYLVDLHSHADLVLLPAIETKTKWHPDAGFCVCALRKPVLWRELK